MWRAGPRCLGRFQLRQYRHSNTRTQHGQEIPFSEEVKCKLEMLGSVPEPTPSPLPKSLLNNQFCLQFRLGCGFAQMETGAEGPGPGFERPGNTATDYSDGPWRGQPRRIHLKVGAAASRSGSHFPREDNRGAAASGRSKPPMSSRLNLRLKKSIPPGTCYTFPRAG